LDPLDVPLLDPLAEQAASKRSPAERVLEVAGRAARPAELLAEFAL
jgi:glutamate--cysteine ligase